MCSCILSLQHANYYIFLTQVSIFLIIIVYYTFQEKRVDKATLEMDPEYPLKYFDDVATDLCTSEKTYMIQEKSRTLQYIIWNVCGRSRFYSKQALRFVGRPEPVVKYHSRAGKIHSYYVPYIPSITPTTQFLCHCIIPAKK